MPKDNPPTPPGSGGGTAPANGTTAACCPTDFQLSPCRIVKVSDSLEIAATELPGFSGGTYKWTTGSAKITLENPDSATVTVKALANPSASRDAEVITVTRTAPGCSPVTKTAKVTVAKITFSASPAQRYGYDDFDTPADNTDDHICVKKSDYTLLHVKIEGGALGTDFDFKCDDETVCKTVAPGGDAEFDLRLNAEAEDKKETPLNAKVKCSPAVSFAKIQVHVYKERVVEVVVAKFDKTTAGTNMLHAAADYAAHAPTANAKLKEAVVKYNITNFDAANAVTAVNLASGTSTVSYDIGSGGGADLTAIKTAMTGTGTKVRVAIIRDMKSYYYLKDAVAVGDTTITVTSATIYQTATTLQLGTGASQEGVTMASKAGSVITLGAPLTKAHAAGTSLEYGAAGWSTDPILIKENASLDIVKWTILHEVGHREAGLKLTDIVDLTDFMHYNQSNTDYRLRYCPRTIYRGGGTENQWDTIPRT